MTTGSIVRSGAVGGCIEGAKRKKDSPSGPSARVCPTSPRAGMLANRRKLGWNGKTLEFLMQVLNNEEVILQAFGALTLGKDGWRLGLHGGSQCRCAKKLYSPHWPVGSTKSGSK